MSDPITTSFWIFEYNLQPALLILSKIAAYDFDDLDLDAVTYGLTSTSSEKNNWFDYELWGKQKIKLLLAREEENTDIIFFQVLHDKELLNGIEICIYTVQEFDIKHRH